MHFNFTGPSLVFIVGLFSFQSYGQQVINEMKDTKPVENYPVKNEVVYELPDTPAEFPGGMDSLKSYLAKSIKYPENALKNKLEGKCYIRFVVTDSGAISNVEVKRGVPGCPECDAETVRVIKAMPLWRPGSLKGRNINSVFSMPISFKL